MWKTIFKAVVFVSAGVGISEWIHKEKKVKVNDVSDLKAHMENSNHI